MIPEILVFSKRTWNSMSAEDRALVSKMAKEAQLEQRKLWYEAEAESLRKMLAAGAIVNEVSNKKAFQEAVRPVWDKYAGNLKPLIDRIQAVN